MPKPEARTASDVVTEMEGAAVADQTRLARQPDFPADWWDGYLSAYDDILEALDALGL